MKKHVPTITPHDPEVTPEVKILPPKKKTDFEYEFVYYNQRAGNVKLAGCFNGWQASQQLVRQPNSDKWSLKVTLPIIEG